MAPVGAAPLAAISFLAVVFIAGLVYVWQFGLPGAQSQVGRATGRAARMTASLATPMGSASRDAIHTMLTQAGFRSESAPYLFFLVRASMALLLPALTLVVVRTDSLIMATVFFAAGMAVGNYLPVGFVQRARRLRIEAIRNAMPQMMEYTLPLLEAGHTVDGTLRQLSTSLRNVAPDLADELSRTITLIDAGMSREEALEGVEAQSGVPELESTLRLMARAERSGASLLDTMRQTASDARQSQIRQTEAAMASSRPLMTVVAVLFNLPMLVVLLVGPALLDAVDQVSGDDETEQR